MRWPLAIGLCLYWVACCACGGAAGPRDEPAGKRDATPSGDPSAVAEVKLEALLKAVERDPDSAAAHRQLALALMDAKRRDESIRHFERAAELDPRDPVYTLNLALIYSTVARFEDAERLYRRLAEVPQVRHIALLNMGNLALKRDELAAAIELYRQALAAKPDYASAYYHLGLALQQAGQLEEAYRTFDEVSKLALPDDPVAVQSYFDAQYRMARLDLELGRTERAAQRLSNLLEVYPNHPQAHYAYAQALVALGRSAEAEAEFNAHVKLMSEQEATGPSATTR